MKKKLKNILREGEPDLMPPGENVTVRDIHSRKSPGRIKCETGFKGAGISQGETRGRMVGHPVASLIK